jgi:hypothetical protein
MDTALYVLAAIITIILSGGTIWSLWIWPRLKDWRDAQRAEQEKLQQMLTDIYNRLNALNFMVDSLSKAQIQALQDERDHTKTHIDLLESITSMDNRLSEMDCVNGKMISLTADRVATLGEHVANMMEEMVRNRTKQLEGEQSNKPI